METVPDTLLEAFDIPFLPMLLEERFGHLYWRGGRPLHDMPKDIDALAADLQMSCLEVKCIIEGLRLETRDILIDRHEFMAREVGTMLLDVRPKTTEGIRLTSISGVVLKLHSLLFFELLPSLQAAPMVITLSNSGARGLSSALYLRNLGVRTYALKGGLDDLSS